jgi:hypothetical protein
MHYFDPNKPHATLISENNKCWWRWVEIGDMGVRLRPTCPPNPHTHHVPQQTLSISSPKPSLMHLLHIITIFSFGGTGVWTQGFTIAKQALYRLSHASSPLWLF